VSERCVLSIAICVCTYDRDEGLQRALAALLGQRLADRQAAHVRLIVVDNYGVGRAADIVAEMAAGACFPIAFVVEADRNISAARNAAVEAAGFVDLILFVDDDEEPEPEWLERIVDRHLDCGADIVLGPVPTRYPPDCPNWIRKGRYFDVTPSMLGVADPARYRIVGGTGNMLCRRMVYDVLGPDPFDHDFGRTGGGDTELFVRALRAGFTIVGAPSAVIWTSQDRDRLTAGFLVKRSFTRGQNYMLILIRNFGRGFAALSRSYVGDLLLLWPAVRAFGVARRNWSNAWRRLGEAARRLRAALDAFAKAARRGDRAAMRRLIVEAARSISALGGRLGGGLRTIWSRILSRFARPPNPSGAFALLLYGVNVVGQVWAFAGLPVRHRY
jgi:succinoglycan biosynthesis protein ExoM